MSYSLELRGGRNIRGHAARQLFMRRGRDPNAASRMAQFGQASPHHATIGPAPPPAPAQQHYHHSEIRLPVNLSGNRFSLTPQPPPRVPSPAPVPAPAPGQQYYRPGEMRRPIHLSRNRFPLILPPPPRVPPPAQRHYRPGKMRRPINLGRIRLLRTLPPPPRVPPAPRQFHSSHIIDSPHRSPPDHLPNPLPPTSPQQAHPGAREIASPSSREAGKRAAAYAAVDAHFGNAPGHVGIGSGSTVLHVVDRIRQLSVERISNTGFVPTGHQSRELLLNAGLRVVRLEDVPGRINVAFDGADEVDGQLNCVKGGGGCLLLEKLVAVRSEVFVVVADRTKLSRTLLTSYRRGIPLEVIPSATPYVLSELRSLGSTDPRVRDGAPAKLGPCITDNGNFIVDAPFPPLATSGAVVELAESLKGIVGVVEHGIFWRGDRRPERVFFGGVEGDWEGVEAGPE